jgi:hypothetical protein
MSTAAEDSNNDNDNNSRRSSNNSSNTPNPSLPPKGHWRMSNEEYYSVYRNSSAAYYLLPIFLGLIGGIIGWAILKNEDLWRAKPLNFILLSLP